GQPGAFTHQAARLKFGASVEYHGVDAIATVFTEVASGHADYGVVPIENSTDGSISDTFDALIGSPLQIINEIHLRIRHHLLSKGPREQVQRIYSKHTVFGQCRQWLAANMPGVELVEVNNTTIAAKRAACEEGAAAIASADAAHNFDLAIIDADIEDDPTNTTRFVVLATADKAAQATGNDKTSLMFDLRDRAGALSHALDPINRAGLNLCRIESRPSRQKAWEYRFFIDVLGHEHDTAVRKALDSLAEVAANVHLLGSYPRAEQPLND
ncbi:MAG: prephenate dehydratase, partial [Planctomycetota bacterium]